MTTEPTQVIQFDTPELKLVEKSKAQQIKDTFLPMAESLQQYEHQFQDILLEYSSEEVITPDLIARARRLRLDISKIRIETGKIKDREKKQYRIAADAIQGVHNIVVWAVTEHEDKLKEIEKHYDRLEAKKKEKLQADRMQQIAPFVSDDFDRDLSSMEPDVWQAFLGAKIKAFEDVQKAEVEARQKQQLLDSRKKFCFRNGFAFNGTSYISHGVEIDIEEDCEDWVLYADQKIEERDQKKAEEEEKAKHLAEIQAIRKDRENELRHFVHWTRPADFDAAALSIEEFDQLLDKLAAEKAKIVADAKKQEKLDKLKVKRQIEVQGLQKHFEVPAYLEIEKLSEKEFKQKLAEAKARKKEADDKDAELERLRKAEEEKVAKQEALAKKNDAAKWLDVRMKLEDIQQKTFRSKKSKDLHIEFISTIDDMLSQIDSL
jgi:hypothetical protein